MKTTFLRAIVHISVLLLGLAGVMAVNKAGGGPVPQLPGIQAGITGR